MQENKYMSIIKDLIRGHIETSTIEKPHVIALYDDLFGVLEPDIRSAAKILKYPEVDDATLRSYFDVAVKEYLSVNPVDIEPAKILNRSNSPTWLTAERDREIEWNYTNRYLKLLDSSGRSESVVRQTTISSLEIMSRLGDPKSASHFYVKGLVVGEVQSGKTGNFNGVINRAIDSGYKLVIVLSGIMEDLRSQTQQRIEADVIGEGIDTESGKAGKKGVGKISGFGSLANSEIEQAVSITSYKSDFKKALADAHFSLNHINVLVCKKNIGVLRNLIVWIHDYLEKDVDYHNIPLLILDDEADNASLNNEGYKGYKYSSKINSYIRALLKLFSRKTYLGYTATPFANVLQDRNRVSDTDLKVEYKDRGMQKKKILPLVDNIFPDDFIILLKSPTNYVGAKQIFDTMTPIENEEGKKIPLVEIINDHIEQFPSRVTEDDCQGV